MKFAVVLFAALFACAAAQPQGLGDLLGSVGNTVGGIVKPVTGAVGGVVGAVGGLLESVKTIVASLVGPDGLVGKLIKGGLGKIVFEVIDKLGKGLGIPGLGCVLKNTVDQLAVVVRQVDHLLTGFVCQAGKAVTSIVIPIANSIEEFLVQIFGEGARGILSSLDVDTLNQALCLLQGVLNPLADTVNVLGAQIGGNNCTVNSTLQHP